MSLYEQWVQGTEDCDNGGHPRAQVQPVQGQVILASDWSTHYNTGL